AFGRAPSLNPSFSFAPSPLPTLGSALPIPATVAPAASVSKAASVSVSLSRPAQRAGVSVAADSPSPSPSTEILSQPGVAAVAAQAPRALSPVSDIRIDADWARVFDGSGRAGASPVPAGTGGRPSLTARPDANNILENAAFLAPAIPYAAGVGVLVGTWFAVRGSNRLIGALTKWRGWASETTVVARLASEVGLWAVGGSVALRVMGLDWTTVFASLGVGGLAVTLATKEFLGNFIRGIVLMVDSPVRIGDRLLLDKRVGRVVDMTFRYIVLEEAPGEFTLITYSSLASAPFTLLPRDAAYAKPEAKPEQDKRPLGKVFWIGAAVAALASAGLGYAVPAALPYVYAAAQLAAAGVLERLAGRWVQNRARNKGWSPTGTAVTRLGLTLAIYSIGLLTGLRTAG
ncbi:MAG: MscS mechanosensitive ion channel, partial [Elusimicrobia bacterium]